MTDTQGSVYGFDIDSELSLSFLRSRNSPGTPLTVRAGSTPAAAGTLLQEWNMGKSGKQTTRLLAMDAEHYIVQIGDADSYEVVVEPPGIIVHPAPIDPIYREGMTWGTPAAVSMAHQGRLPFHAGSVDVDGRAVILAATGSFGKTTLAGAFHAAGYRLLADDMSCAVVDPEPALLPGPAVIRARPDVVAGFTFQRATARLETPERAHFVLDPGTGGNGDPVPLRAIVFLRISEGQIRMETASKSDVVRDLFGLSFRLPTDEGVAATFALASELAGRVPAWNLRRPLTIESLPKVIETIVDTCFA